MSKRDSSQTGKSDSSQSSLKLLEVGTITALLVPLLYTAGWSFAYHYFEHFYLGLIGLDIPKEYLFQYSLWVLKDQIPLSLAGLIIAVSVWFIADFCFATPEKPKSKLWQTIGLIIIPVLILSLFALLYYMGDAAGKSVYEKQAKSDFSSYPSVKVWLTEEARKEVRIAPKLEDGCYRLLLRNKDFLYLFSPSKYTEKIPTEIISSDKVRMIRVLPFYHSCKD